MGSALSYRVSGDKATVAAFKRLGLSASDLSRVFGEIGRDVAEDARQLAPTLTGTLAADVRAGRAKTRATVAVGRKSVPYAGPINFGWKARNIAPALFMQKAADTKADSSAIKVAREMTRLIRAAGLN